MASRTRSTPATLEHVAPLLIAVGAALLLAGIADIGFFFFPAGFGDSSWEFGTIGQLMDSMPGPTMGILLLAVGARARGWNRVTRALAVLCALAALAILAMLVIFLLDLPVAWHAMTNVNGQPANDMVRAGLKRGIAKYLVLLPGYLGCYVTLTIAQWRSLRGATRE